MDMEGTSHKSRFARVIKGRKGVEELTMVLEEVNVCSIWLSITKILHFLLSSQIKVLFHSSWITFSFFYKNAEIIF